MTISEISIIDVNFSSLEAGSISHSDPFALLVISP